MKQAILITVYHQIDLLRKIVDFFDEDFDIYIHIDKKCKEDYSGIANDHVFVFSKYRIYWGSEYHLFAIMYLVQAAHARGPYSYYHLITGNDYPVKSLSEFKNFFSEENKINYIEYHKLPRSTWPNEGGIGRIRYFWIGNQVDDIRKHHKLVDLLLKVQRKIGVRRKFVKKYPNLYGGGTYWSLKEEAIVFLLKNNDLSLMRFTHCAEEVFIHTILLTGIKSQGFENDSLRYMCWDGNNSSPNILVSKDYPAIIKSSAFWCRKVDLNDSKDLIKIIQNECKIEKKNSKNSKKDYL